MVKSSFIYNQVDLKKGSVINEKRVTYRLAKNKTKRTNRSKKQST